MEEALHEIGRIVEVVLEETTHACVQEVPTSALAAACMYLQEMQKQLEGDPVPN